MHGLFLLGKGLSVWHFQARLAYVCVTLSVCVFVRRVNGFSFKRE